MQKYDWLRLFSEVRPTFLPYARFTVRTRLTLEECRERLAAVTQPQRMPTLFSTPTSSGTQLVFKGQVSKAGFFVCPVDHIGLRKYQGPRPSQYKGPEPFWLCGRFKSFYNGTNIVVQVFPDPLALLVGCALLSLVSLQAVLYQSVPLGELLSPLLFARVFCCYAILAFPVSFKAFLSRKTLERLLA
jgi:hypothetical protein